jgi:hypothetical protein
VGELVLATHWSRREVDEMDDADIQFWIEVMNEGSEASALRSKQT